MRRQGAKVRVGEIADRQWGRVKWAQIKALGVDRRVASDWQSTGYISRVLPGVYAVGHRAPSTESDLAAALLYAGPGAALSHASAAWWLGLADEQPRSIHVSTPRRCRSQPGVIVHERRSYERIRHRELPLTTVAQTLVDFAAEASLRGVRLALARADYQGRLDLTAIEAAAGRGRPGSARLRQALERHQPAIARTKSQLEVLFVELCERAGFPAPETNQRLAGWEVDALFRTQGIAVELDGYDNHRSRAQVRRDRRKELDLRAVGLTPVRYTEEQVERHRGAVEADLRRLGLPTARAAPRTPRSARTPPRRRPRRAPTPGPPSPPPRPRPAPPRG